MYRIIFDTEKCAWIVQLLKFQVLWTTLKGKEFPNHVSAVDYVDQVGLNKVYRDYAQSTMHQLLDGAR